MTAYVVFIREETTNHAELEVYAKEAPAAADGHAVSFLTLYGKQEVVEGEPLEGVAILQFPTFEEAKKWYESPAYQKASTHRHRGAKYRVIIVDSTN